MSEQRISSNKKRCDKCKFWNRELFFPDFGICTEGRNNYGSMEKHLNCSKFKPLKDSSAQKEVKTGKFFDKHYAGSVQPIEVMQEHMSHDEFIGFLRGNIIKYACRLGKKDSAEKEAAKIYRYSEWLLQAIRGEKINLRKE